MRPGSPVHQPGVRSRHLDRLCLQTRRLRAIPRLVTASRGDFERLLEALCAAAPSLFPDAADAACVLLDDGGRVLRVRAASGFGPTFMENASIRASEAAALVALDGGMIRWARPQRPPPSSLDDETLESGLICPLFTRGDLGGLLLFGAHRSGEAFSDDDVLYAEVLATLVAGHLAEITLGRSVLRLQRALWTAAQTGSSTEAPAPPAPNDDGGDEADEVDTLPRYRSERRARQEVGLSEGV